MNSILVGNKYIIQTLKSHQMHNNNINGQFESAEIMSNLYFWYGKMSSNVFLSLTFKELAQTHSPPPKLGHPTHNCSISRLFFLKRNAFIKTRNCRISLWPHQTGDFSDAHFNFASAPGASQTSVERNARQMSFSRATELRSDEMLHGYMSVKQAFLAWLTAVLPCSRRTLFNFTRTFNIRI